jgi:hypothetical protein
MSHQIWTVSEIGCDGNQTATHLAQTETQGNTIYAMLGAGTPLAAGTVLVELWTMELDDTTNAILSKKLITYRPLVPGAVCPYAEAREYIDNELAGITLDLTVGMAPVTDAITGVIMQNQADIDAVTLAIAKKISTQAGLNTKDMNNILAALQGVSFSLTAPNTSTPAIVGQTTEPKLLTLADGTTTPLPIYTVSPTLCATPYTAWFYTDSSTIQQFPDLKGALDYANSLLAKNGLPLITQQQVDAFVNDIQAPSSGEYASVSLGTGGGSAADPGIQISAPPTQPCTTNQTTVAPLQTPIAGNTLPTAPPIVTLPSIVPTTTMDISAQSTPVTPDIQPTPAPCQSVSPVVDWNDAFAGVTGLLTPDQISKVRVYLDPLIPTWDYPNLMASIASAMQDDLPDIVR